MKQPELNEDVIYRLIGESHLPLSREIYQSPIYWKSRVQDVTQSRFIFSGKRNNISYVRYALLENLIDPGVDNNKTIREAAGNGNTEIVRLLLADKRVDPSADNNYAIRLATRNGHIEVVRLLLEDERVDPSDNDNYAIILAAVNGYTEVVKLLLADKRVDPFIF